MAGDPLTPPLKGILAEDEEVAHVADVGDAILAATNRRVAITDDARVHLDTTYEGLRRIQFDIERDRPATLVIVPESPQHGPQVLAIPPSRYEDICRALAYIGQRLSTT